MLTADCEKGEEEDGAEYADVVYRPWYSLDGCRAKCRSGDLLQVFASAAEENPCVLLLKSDSGNADTCTTRQVILSVSAMS